MLIHPKSEEIYPVGTIIEANISPGNNWMPCAGQILSQSSYPILYAMMDNPHPNFWSDWKFCDDYDTGGDYPYSRRCEYNGSEWVAASYDSLVSRSTDGINWSLITVPGATYDYNGPAWNGSVWCMVAYNTNVGATSSDGTSWTLRTLNLSADWSDVVWDGTYFLAFAYDSTQIIKSTDGITWSNAGTLSKTGYYEMASDGAGTTVIINGGGDIEYSTNNGSTWTHLDSTVGFYCLTYTNSLFLVGTREGYVGISSNGADWEWRPYASCSYEGMGNFGYNPIYVTRWRYYDGVYFGVSGYYGTIGIYSFDLRSFYPWFNNPCNSELYDVIYNSSSGNLTCFGYYGYNMPYTQKKEMYNPSTHFQLPTFFDKRFFDNGKHRYIRYQ